MGLYDFSFYDLIERNAVCFCNQPAWFEVDDQRAITFAEYKNRVDRLACGLKAMGIKKGDRIGAFGKNSLEFFFSMGRPALSVPLCCRSTGDFRLKKHSLTSTTVNPRYCLSILNTRR